MAARKKKATKKKKATRKKATKKKATSTEVDDGNPLDAPPDDEVSAPDPGLRSRKPRGDDPPAPAPEPGEVPDALPELGDRVFFRYSRSPTVEPRDRAAFVVDVDESGVASLAVLEPYRSALAPRPTGTTYVQGARYSSSGEAGTWSFERHDDA